MMTGVPSGSAPAAIAFTQRSWSASGSPTGAPSAVRHTRTVFDFDGLRQFAAALLAQEGMDRPGPPGAAWTQYRARHGVW